LCEAFPAHDLTLEAGMGGSPLEETLHHLDEEERRLLDRFLVTIRHDYRLADKAVFYLERKAGIQYMAAVANLRDVLSHLATFLDPATQRAKRAEQLATAGEHLRRSIIDSYEVALADLEVKFQKLYEQYREFLLPVSERDAALSRAPNSVQIESTLTEVEALIQNAREAKCSNSWDDSWEDGIAGYPAAYDKLEKLYSEMEGYWYRYEQQRRDRRSVRLAIWGIAMTVLTAILALVVSYLLYTRGRS
jgi:hypothetical protein